LTFHDLWIFSVLPAEASTARLILVSVRFKADLPDFGSLFSNKFKLLAAPPQVNCARDRR